PPTGGGAPRPATSARQSPPSASIIPRSVTIFPGSCTARGARHRASPSVRPRPTPVTRAVSASTTVPAWDTRPLPSADTAILARRAILFTWKVPLLGADRTFSKPYPPRPKALPTHTTRRRSHSAESPRLTCTAPCSPDGHIGVRCTVSLGIRPIGPSDRSDLGTRCTVSDRHGPCDTGTNGPPMAHGQMLGRRRA